MQLDGLSNLSGANSFPPLLSSLCSVWGCSGNTNDCEARNGEAKGACMYQHRLWPCDCNQYPRCSQATTQ